MLSSSQHFSLSVPAGHFAFRFRKVRKHFRSQLLLGEAGRWNVRRFCLFFAATLIADAPVFPLVDFLVPVAQIRITTFRPFLDGKKTVTKRQLYEEGLLSGSPPEFERKRR